MQYIIPSPSDLFPGRTARLPQLLPAQIARPAALPSLPRDFSGRKRKAEKTSAWKFSPLSVQGNRRPLFDGDLLHLLRFDGFLFFGMSMVSTPFCTFASILSFSTFSGRIITCWKRLYENSRRRYLPFLSSSLCSSFFLHRNDQLVIGVDFHRKNHPWSFPAQPVRLYNPCPIR